MWRLLKLIYPINRTTSASLFLKRQYSANRLYGAKTVLISFGTVSLASASAIFAYGKYDSDFRKLVEENVPYSDQVFKILPEFKKDPAILSDDKIIASDSLPQITMDVPSESQAVDKTQDDNIKKQHVENKEIENTDEQSENFLRNLLMKLHESFDEVDFAQTITIKAIQDHSKKLYIALNDHNDSVDTTWSSVQYTYDVKMSMLKYLQEKLNSLRDVINELERKMKIIQNEVSDVLLCSIRANIYQARGFIESVETNVKNFEINSTNTSDYKALIEKSKSYFQDKHGFTFLNKVDPGNIETITTHLMNLVNEEVTNACKEVFFKKKIFIDKENKNVAPPKNDSENVKAIIIAKKKIREKALKEEFKKELTALNKKFEEDTRKQVLFQLTLHMEHLQNSLKAQERRLNKEFSEELEKQLSKQKNNFYLKSSIRIKNIEAYLNKSLVIMKKSRKANELFYVCQTLKNKLESWNLNKRVPVNKEVKLLDKIKGRDNEFVTTVLSGISSNIIEQGVYNEQYLSKRFDKVKRLCKQVAMIDENHYSLYRYTLSYFQSFFIIDIPHIMDSELEGNQAVDPSSWDTFDILNRIEFCVKRNDFEQALRYANQLRGEPRTIARDWILDVTSLLELRQAITCLTIYSSAIGVQSYH